MLSLPIPNEGEGRERGGKREGKREERGRGGERKDERERGRGGARKDERVPGPPPFSPTVCPFCSSSLPSSLLSWLLFLPSLSPSRARGRLGGAVAVGMGDTLGPGETGRRCMFISQGGATRGLTRVQCGKQRGRRGGVCAPAMHRHNTSRGRPGMAG